MEVPVKKEIPKNYFKRELAMLRFFGANIAGKESMKYKIFCILYMSLYLSFPIVGFSDLFKHDFDIVSDLLIYEFASVIANTEFIVAAINLKKIKKLLNQLEEEPFRPNYDRGGEEEEKLIRGCLSFTRIQATICWVSVLVTVGLATVFTLIKRIRSSDYHDWEFTYGPLTVLNVTYSPNFEITWLYQILCTTALGSNHCTINLIMAGILAHSSVQFQVLQNNIKRIAENAYMLMMRDTQEGENVNFPSAGEIDPSTIPFKYLKISVDSTVRYHLKILGIMKEMENIFSLLMLLIFLLSLAVLCFLVYHASVLEINDMRMVKTITDAVTALFPVMLLCYWSQEVVHESQKVATTAMEANFVGADRRFQKSLNLIVRRSQRAMQLKAGKLIDINLTTFVWIVRASYSSFMLLRKVNGK